MVGGAGHVDGVGKAHVGVAPESLNRVVHPQPVAAGNHHDAVHAAAVTYSAISTATKIEHAIAAETMQQRAANLQEYALRKVTLGPGQQVRGYLYFPRYDAADALVVKAPVGNCVVPLEFTQVRKRMR